MRRHRHVTIAFLGGAAAALSGCMTEGSDRSAQTASSGRQCFHAGSVNGFVPVDDDTVDVTISTNRRYRLELSAGCNDVDWAQQIALRSRTGSFICSPLDAELFVPNSTVGPGRCLVTDIRQLTREEIEAARNQRR